MLICEAGLLWADVLALVDVGMRLKRKPSVCAYLNSNISEYAPVQLQIHLNIPETKIPWEKIRMANSSRETMNVYTRLFASVILKDERDGPTFQFWKPLNLNLLQLTN